MTIQDALNAKIPELIEFNKRNKEIVDIAIALDGQMRTSGGLPCCCVYITR